MKSLKLLDVTKEYVTLRRRTMALRQLNLEIRPREFFVLLGPSGCGKSTLLNVIAGIDKPTNGDIWLGEELFCSVKNRRFLSPRERNVAMVFQDYALYPHLTVAQNIGFPLRIRRVAAGEIDAAVAKTAERLGLGGLLAAKPAELSGGQRQRVAIARAIIRRPNLFLLDEPLSNLDAQLRASTRIELKELQVELAVTTVYVTHDQVEAMTLGDRIAVLREGRLEQVGTPEELYERPANAFVGRFIGSPPMNLLRARLSRAGETGTLHVAGNEVELSSEESGRFSAAGSDPFLAGIRPEDLRLTDGPAHIRARVTGAERLGRETLVYVSAGEETVTFLVEEGIPASGEEVGMSLDLGRVHVFTGERSVRRDP
jgi:multiple sugar transport system ATP-binding protein